MDEDMKRVAEAATPGSWAFRNGSEIYVRPVGADGQIKTWVARVEQRSGNWHKDGEFIATFDPPTVLSLLSRLSAAEAENARLREALERISNCAVLLSEYHMDGVWNGGVNPIAIAKATLNLSQKT